MDIAHPGEGGDRQVPICKKGGYFMMKL